MIRQRFRRGPRPREWKSGGRFRHPFDELPQMWMAPQRLDRVVTASKLGLGQGGMDFRVANLVQQHLRPTLAAAQFRRQVVTALPDMRRDRAVAKRADRVGGVSQRRSLLFPVGLCQRMGC